MISPPALPRSEVTFALCVFFILLSPLAGAGLSLINTGLGRSSSAAQAIVSSLCVIAVDALVYFVLGSSWAGFPGRPFHAHMVGGASWNWLGADPFFLRGRSEEHTSELQSRQYLVCRLLLEKKKKKQYCIQNEFRKERNYNISLKRTSSTYN